MTRLLTLALVILVGCDAPSTPPGDAGSSDAARRDAGTGDGATPDANEVDDAGSDGGNDASVPLEDVHFVGRFDVMDDGTASSSWPGSEIVAVLDGTDISVDLEASGEVFFEAVIDGERGDAFATTSGSHTYVLAEGLSDAPHEVHLVRRSETFVGGGATTFQGFGTAEIVPSPAPYAHLIEFVGDSITCGYGALGDGPGCGFTPATESEADAYGAVAARMLGAGHTAIAWSGIGLVHNYGGGTDGLMGVRFERTFGDRDGDWSFAYTPDAVVVNLGTNDYSGGNPGTAFADAMDAFVMQIRGHYPNAWIFLATSPMLGGSDHTTHAAYLATAVDRATDRGDARVLQIELPTQLASDGLGCDYHPSTTTHALGGAIVADAIREALGW